MQDIQHYTLYAYDDIGLNYEQLCTEYIVIVVDKQLQLHSDSLLIATWWGQPLSTWLQRCKELLSLSRALLGITNWSDCTIPVLYRCGDQRQQQPELFRHLTVRE